MICITTSLELLRSDAQVKDYNDYYIAMTRLNASNEGPQNE